MKSRLKIGRNLVLFGHDALGIVGVGGAAKGDLGQVLLGLQGQILKESRGRSDGNHQQAGAEGIERAGVAHAPGAEAPTDQVDDAVRRAPERLIDQEDAKHSLSSATSLGMESSS